MKNLKILILSGFFVFSSVSYSQTAQSEAEIPDPNIVHGTTPAALQRRNPPKVLPILPEKFIKVGHGNYLRGGYSRFFQNANRATDEKYLKAMRSTTDVQIDIQAECLCTKEQSDNDAITDKLFEQVICKEPLSEAVWDEVHTPPYDKLKSKNLTLAQAKRYLIRFAKSGGYNKEKHASILTAILLNNDVIQALSKEVFFAAQMISFSNNYEELQTLFKLQIPLPVIPPYKESDVCRSEGETLGIREAAVARALDVAKTLPNDFGTDLPSLWSIQLLVPSLNAGPPEAKTEIKNKMYRVLATGAVEYEYKGLFISKALLFTKSYVNKIFGDPAKEFSELTATADGGKTRYFLLGTTELETGGIKSTVNDYGIHSVALRGPATPAIGKSANLPVTWKHQNESYSANVKLHSKSVTGLVSKSKAPDYDKMWADKKMSGVVLVSDNLGEFKAKATEHYIQYYAEKGFNFDSPQDIPDTEQWLKKNISDGTVDYVLKDAHAGGNTSSLMNFSKSHKIMKGTKTLADGKTEVVYIMAPGPEKAESSQKLRYDDMKDWMKKRQQDDKGPLVYLNSSCWSLDQAKYEVPAIENPLFVNIASTTKTTTFVNSKNSTKYHIMDGIREGQSYEQMRSGMSTTTRYKTGTNQFKFPDEAVYQKAFEKLTEVQVSIKDSKGAEYTLEDAAH